MSRILIDDLARPREQSFYPEKSNDFDSQDYEIIGSSRGIRLALDTLKRFATSSDAPVLITGESGTGKELAAHLIHKYSTRSDKPFIPINCGGIPENLLESELFGHEKGAFTGAHLLKKGKFELADSGTLFLDEIGSLPLNLQVKILRVMQDLRFERLGSNRIRQVDVRVVAATNVNFYHAVREGNFREDLYYRLAVLSITLPPLREREEDLMVLARYFLNLYSKSARRELRGFTPEAVNAIHIHSWPGNVRELINRVRRAVVMADGDQIEPTDLGFNDSEQEFSSLSLPLAKSRLEKDLIKKAMARSNGNVAKAAQVLEISCPHLYQLIKKHGLSHVRRGETVPIG